MKSRHDSRAIANEMLDLADEMGLKLTIMQLIKLVYMAHGFSLAILGEPLSKHRFVSGQFGPFVSEIHDAFRKAGSAPIGRRAVEPFFAAPYGEEFSDKEEQIFAAVLKKYGTLNAFKLSTLLDQDGEPWRIVTAKNGAYSPIPDALIKRSFIDRVEQNGRFSRTA